LFERRMLFERAPAAASRGEKPRQHQDHRSQDKPLQGQFAPFVECVLADAV
jgi:hypothetical protein